MKEMTQAAKLAYEKISQVMHAAYDAADRDWLMTHTKALTELEALQTGKPEKKKMVFNTELNEQCLKLMTSGKANIDVLKTLVQNNSQQLHKITISLWIARAYLAENNRREAEKLLEQIVKLAPELYPGKAAAQLLNALPAKTESND